MHLRAYTSVLKQSPCGRAIFKPYKVVVRATNSLMMLFDSAGTVQALARCDDLQVSCVRGQVRALRERSADAKDAQVRSKT